MATSMYIALKKHCWKDKSIPYSQSNKKYKHIKRKDFNSVKYSQGSVPSSLDFLNGNSLAEKISALGFLKSAKTFSPGQKNSL